MQRNVTKCIGIAGKAAPCGGAGPSRVQSLRGTSDAACNQEKKPAGDGLQSIVRWPFGAFASVIPFCR